jgi:hypothetical protein
MARNASSTAKLVIAVMLQAALSPHRAAAFARNLLLASCLGGFSLFPEYAFGGGLEVRRDSLVEKALESFPLLQCLRPFG